MIGRRLILFAALAAALAALGGCRRDAAGPNIVLVAMDGLRADHVGAYGYEEKTTPFIDFLASKGTRFEHAYTTSPWTLPAYASLLSGTAPATHLLNDEAAHARADLASLPGLLQEAGYRTAAFVSNTKLRKDKGFAAGFDRYYYLPNASARSLSDRAAEWLAGHRGESFFLMLQYSDLQIPYAPPARFIRRHYPEDLEPHTAGPLDMIRLMRAADEAERESRLAAFRALYDAEIDAADEGLSLFYKALQNLELDRNTVIVLVSPFGQSLFEHGLLGHGTSLYDDEIRVPFIVADPARVAPGAVLPGPAGLADVAPTILGITGARPPDGMEGVSLWPLLTNAPSAPEVAAFLETRALFVETNRRGPSRFAVIKERRKFIASPPFGLFGHRFGSAVYDLDADPGETDNLLAGDESLAAPFDEAIEQAGGYRRATQWSVLFGAGKQVYSGTVSTAGTLYEIYKDDVVLGVEGEGRVVFNDLLMLPAADAIRFAAAEMERPNGFRFFVRPEGALVHFTLLADGRRAPKRIALGASSEQPHRIPFVIGGGYAGSDLQPAPGAYRVFSERLWISDTAAEGRRAEESVGPSVELLEKLRRRVRPWEKGPAKALEQYLRGAP